VCAISARVLSRQMTGSSTSTVTSVATVREIRRGEEDCSSRAVTAFLSKVCGNPRPQDINTGYPAKSVEPVKANLNWRKSLPEALQ
jgi:hypothetical protein